MYSSTHTARRGTAIIRAVLIVLLLIGTLTVDSPNIRANPVTPRLIDDGTFIFAPGFDHTAIQAFLDRQSGKLGTYQATLDGVPAPAADVIAVASLGEPTETNPKVLLTLLEIAGGFVTTANPAPATLQHPFNINQQTSSSFESDLFAMGDLLRRSFAAYEPTATPLIRLGNGSDYQLPILPNAGTYALEVALGQLAPDQQTFERLIGDGNGSFRATFIHFFGDPSSAITPQASIQATTPFLYKPFVGNFSAGSFLDHDKRSNIFIRFDGTSTGGYDGHDATDYPMSSWNTVIAAADGTIIDVANNRTESGAGVTWCIGFPYTPVTGMVISHTVNGVVYKTWYWHFSSGAIGTNPRTNQQFKIGDTILRGETVGFSGTTGCSTGPHLHFGVQRSGAATDPYGWCGSSADPYPNFSEVLWAAAMTNPSPCSANPPVMYIDTPGDGATVSGNISFSGWATHAAAASGTGVDAVHIYFDGGAGTGARGVVATYGLQRDDVAASFGDRYRYSGYQLVLHSSEFSLGQHTIYVYAHSIVTDQWQTTTRTFTVGNISPNTPTSMTPAPGATISGQTVQFAWQDPGDPDNRPRNSRDYAIEVRNSTGQIVAQMPWALTTTWSTNLANGTYTWHIQSGDGLTGSAWSADRSFTVLANPIPAAPDSLQVISRTANSLRLTWRDNATNETGYRVYRWNGSIWAQLATLGAGATSYTDTYLNYPFGYSYLVAAFNAAGERSATTWASGYIANAVSDFNNDGSTDILWRNTASGLNYTYFMRGASIAGSGTINTVASLNWKVAGTADFNGDGLNDILWRNVATGQNTIYFMRGATIISSATINIVADQNWKIAGVADTNNDGRADILWRNTLTGQNALYLMNGASVVSSTAINTVAIPDWQIVGFDDFNFDNRADILWRNTRTGTNVIYLMNGAQIMSSAVINTVAVPDWQIVGTGDTNGDGRADILWRNTRTGQNVIYFMNGLSILSSGVINTVAIPDWKVVGTGDLNGDGRADILWHNTRTGQNVAYLMNGLSILSSGVINTVADPTWKIVGKGSNTEASVGQGLASIIDEIPPGAGNGLTMDATDGGDIATMQATDGGDIATMQATDGGDIATMQTTDGGDIATMATPASSDMLGPNGETASEPPSGEQPLREPTLADLPPSAQQEGTPSGTTQITLPMVISPIQ